MTENLAPAFFVPEADGWRATQWTRGPWSMHHQHAGPPAALLLRAIEQLLQDSPAMHVSRVTWEILRPIPIARFAVQTQVLRAGRKVRWLGASLIDEQGREVMRAAAVCMRTQSLPVEAPRFDPEPPPSVAASTPFEFAFFADGPSYRKAMEARLARGVHGSGQAALWMRMRYPLVPDEQPSPAQRVACAADSGSGVSMALDTTRYTFINPDLTVYLARAPTSEWLCLDSCTRIGGQGTGLCETQLFGEDGYLGSAQQSLLVEGVARGG